MLSESIHRTPRPQDICRMTTEELRDAFLICKLFSPAELRGQFTDLDRLAVGGVTPVAEPILLQNHKETGRAFFLERREMGIINIGATGKVVADGKAFTLEKLDCAYVPMGTREVKFCSNDLHHPARFYFLSCPAHTAHPAGMIKAKDATAVALGSPTSANQRTIYKFIHQGGIQSCQLVMGFTALEPGSVWNSFPPHTHCRRSEIYFYFDLEENIVSHFMGEPPATRHLFLHNEQVVLSPNWSIHCGCGTANYKFIWGMAGENQVFDDVDPVKPLNLR